MSIDLAMRMRIEMGSAMLKHLFLSLLSILVYSLCIKHAAYLSVGKQRPAAHSLFSSVSDSAFNCSASWGAYTFKCKDVSNHKPCLHHEHLSLPHGDANVTSENEMRQS